MYNKLYENTKKFIKENYKKIIIFILFIVFIFFPTNYEIYTSGGLINLDERITVNNKEKIKNKGNFNLTYVSSRKGFLSNYLLSFVLPSWDKVNVEDITLENENYNELIKRNVIELKLQNTKSIICAMKYTNSYYKIVNQHVVVLGKTKENKNDLKIGDIILTVNNHKINNLGDLTQVLNNNLSEVLIVVKRDKKEINIRVPLVTSNYKKILGIVASDYYEVETNHNIKIKDKKNESGPSGGLMTSLEIVDSITTGDLTKGKVIAGSGTIDIYGNVGEIGGIKYKLLGADKKKADIFICPSGNYKEALKVKKDNNLKIQLIEADNLVNVIKKLNNL